MRAALAARDVARLYRLVLAETSLSQRQLATLTGQHQPEVWEICTHDRQVTNVLVLKRIADGLGIPRELMRLAGAPEPGAYPEQVTVANPTEGDEMLRRHFDRLLGLAGAAALGVPIPGLGDITELAEPGVEPPERIGLSDVETLKGCHQTIRMVARAQGGQAEAGCELARWGDQLLEAEASDNTRTALLVTLSGLHSGLGWWCHDSHNMPGSLYHFGRGVELATEAKDPYGAAYSLRHAGMALIERGQVQQELKLLELADMRLQTASRSPELDALRAEAHVVTAFALARSAGEYESAVRLARAELARARDWDPPTANARGNLDGIAAQAELELGRFDVAETMAATSGQAFADAGNRREGVLMELVRAQLHLQAGEPRGLAMASKALDGVQQTRSGVARQIYVPPLAAALEARSGSDAQELARRARQVAA